MSFATWLQQIMERRGAGIRKLAEYVGVVPATVHAWVHGTSRPSYESCVKIAAYLSLSEDEVLAQAGRPHRPLKQRASLFDAELDMLARQAQEELNQDEKDSIKPYLEFVLGRKRATKRAAGSE